MQMGILLRLVVLIQQHTTPHYFLWTLIYSSSDHEQLIITTPHWTASLSDEKVIHLRKSALSCIWIISLNNIKFWCVLLFYLWIDILSRI